MTLHCKLNTWPDGGSSAVDVPCGEDGICDVTLPSEGDALVVPNVAKPIVVRVVDNGRKNSGAVFFAGPDGDRLPATPKRVVRDPGTYTIGGGRKS